MAIHQHDADANDLWLYFQTVINWARMLFPTSRKGMTDAQDWGFLYNKYHNKQYNSNTLEANIQKLLMDDDVTKNSGIIPYVLSDRTKHDEKNLSIRAFTEAQKRRAYERQGHKCPCCVKNGIDTEYAYNEMQGTISFRGHKVAERLIAIYKCFVRNVIMTRVISKEL